MKHLYASLCALLMASSVYAADALPGQQLKHISLQPAPSAQMLVTPVQAPAEATLGLSTPASRAELSMPFTPAGSPYTAIGPNKVGPGYTLAEAFQFTNAYTKQFAGNQIVNVFFAAAVSDNEATMATPITTYTVELRESLTSGEPFASKTVTVDPSTEAYSTIAATLDEPYTIESGKPFFVVVKCIYPDTEYGVYPLVVDYLYHDGDEGGYVCWAAPGEELSNWQNIASQYGFVCVGTTLVGENLPTNTIYVPQMEVAEVVMSGQPFDVIFYVMNEGANTVTDFDFTIQIGDQAPVTETFHCNEQQQLGYGQYLGIRYGDAVYNGSGANIPVTVSLPKVNGVDNALASEGLSVLVNVLPEGAGFQKNIVVEEFTGTWCQFCPRGYSIMEQVRENYPEGSIIPVAVHGPDAANDAMYAPTFKQLLALNTVGYPSALLNRSYTSGLDSYESLIEECEALQQFPAIGKVEAHAEVFQATTSTGTPTNKKKYQVYTTTTFALDFPDAQDRYILSFAVTEDGVGPDYQVNAFAGQPEDSPYYDPFWSTQPEYVELMFNDVARQLNTYNGIGGSIPDAVVANQPYEYVYSTTLGSTVKDPDKINIVVYLLDRKTKAVVNAATVKSADLGHTNGVEDITISDQDANAPVEYFNLQGQRVAEPTSGIYVRRQGSKVSKIAL